MGGGGGGGYGDGGEGDGGGGGGGTSADGAELQLSEANSDALKCFKACGHQQKINCTPIKKRHASPACFQV